MKIQLFFPILLRREVEVLHVSESCRPVLYQTSRFESHQSFVKVLDKKTIFRKINDHWKCLIILLAYVINVVFKIHLIHVQDFGKRHQNSTFEIWV